MHLFIWPSVPDSKLVLRPSVRRYGDAPNLTFHSFHPGTVGTSDGDVLWYHVASVSREAKADTKLMRQGAPHAVIPLGDWKIFVRCHELFSMLLCQRLAEGWVVAAKDPRDHRACSSGDL